MTRHAPGTTVESKSFDSRNNISRKDCKILLQVERHHMYYHHLCSQSHSHTNQHLQLDFPSHRRHVLILLSTLIASVLPTCHSGRYGDLPKSRTRYVSLWSFAIHCLALILKHIHPFQTTYNPKFAFHFRSVPTCLHFLTTHHTPSPIFCHSILTAVKKRAQTRRRCMP